MKRESKGRDLTSKGAPLVRFVARPAAGIVRLHVERDSRREAKSDRTFELSSSEARELLRALQAGADEADRLAYQAAKNKPPESLEEIVEELAEKLES